MDRELHRTPKIREQDSDEDAAHSPPPTARHGSHRRHPHSRSKAVNGGGGRGGGGGTTGMPRRESSRHNGVGGFDDADFATPAAMSMSTNRRKSKSREHGRGARGGSWDRDRDRAMSLPPQHMTQHNPFATQSTPVHFGRADADELARVAESPGRKLVRVAGVHGSNTSINSTRSMPSSSGVSSRLTSKSLTASSAGGPGLTRKVSMMI